MAIEKISLVTKKSILRVRDSLDIKAVVDGENPRDLTFHWQVTTGHISWRRHKARYEAPGQKGTAEIQVRVTDRRGGERTESLSLTIYKQIAILKADDVMFDEDTIIPAGWRRYFDTMIDKKIKSSAGIICNSLTVATPAYFYRLKELARSGYIEFFNHGYDHVLMAVNENGETYCEFWNTSYEHQKEHFLKAQNLAKQKLNITMHTFGAPGNRIDHNTVKAINEVGDLKIWLYGDSAAHKLVLTNRKTLESPLPVPNYEAFLADYDPDLDYCVFQLHPRRWSDEDFAQYERIIDYLIDQEVTFLTPYEYYQAVTHSQRTEIVLDRSRLNFGAVTRGGFSGPQKVGIQNPEAGTLNWQASVTSSWIKVRPSSGRGAGQLEVSVEPGGLRPGTHTGAVIVADAADVNAPRQVNVSLEVYKTNAAKPPFGEFSTPEDGAEVSGSIALTGWVLDDIGVKRVDIFTRGTRIGEAFFVEGARPDIEAIYPGYPANYLAGWGYMLLTNCLPGGGNGSYKLKAVATDMEGKQTTLGVKTIQVENAQAGKPFGAIDTPPPGGTASGGSYRNQGWVLTPQPNKIPEDGSTIEVHIDGIKHGTAQYNLHREDIADLFPGYANSGGAGAVYTIDTTAFNNGVHSISWVVRDNAGHAEGIGSRYFTIING